MASISNTGRSITIAFSEDEINAMAARGGDDWKWQTTTFDIDESGIGSFTLRADMHNGRKLGKMTNVEGNRWMLVIQSHLMPMVPYFSRIKDVEVTVTDADPKVTRIFLPKELPALDEKKVQRAQLAAKKPRVFKTPRVAGSVKPATPAPASAPSQAVAVIPQAQQRNGSNLTLLIEGKSFRYEVPIEDRLRIMADLSRFAVAKEA